jgi:hypothetical protein
MEKALSSDKSIQIYYIGNPPFIDQLPDQYSPKSVTQDNIKTLELNNTQKNFLILDTQNSEYYLSSDKFKLLDNVLNQGMVVYFQSEEEFLINRVENVANNGPKDIVETNINGSIPSTMYNPKNSMPIPTGPIVNEKPKNAHSVVWLTKENNSFIKGQQMLVNDNSDNKYFTNLLMPAWRYLTYAY